MLINHWLNILQRTFGGFPNDYTVLDIETSGVDAGIDLILNIGHVIVEDGQVTQRLDAFLDWTREGQVDQQWLYDRMEKTRQQMAGNGREYKMSYELLRDQGEDPIGILREYHDLIVAQREAKYAFVMHNGYNFDAPRLCNHFKRWLNENLEFGPSEIWDTGMIEKASQLNSMPDPKETMRAWAKRVGGIRAKGVKWSLDAHCIPKYDLANRFQLNESEAHGAGFDTYVTHLLFEEFRRLAMEYQAPPAPPPSAPIRRPIHGQANQSQGRVGPSDRDDDPGGRYGHLGG